MFMTGACFVCSRTRLASGVETLSVTAEDSGATSPEGRGRKTGELDFSQPTLGLSRATSTALAPRPFRYRSPAMPISSYTGTRAVAVTPHHLATQAAVDVMRGGGNAADAVIAANAVLGMVLPSTCGIGGDLFAIVHRPGWDRPDVLNASGRGGSGLDADRLRSAGHSGSPTAHRRPSRFPVVSMAGKRSQRGTVPFRLPSCLPRRSLSAPMGSRSRRSSPRTSV